MEAAPRGQASGEPAVLRLIPMAHSIFVPITTDLTAPLEDKAKNNTQRIERTMRNIDAHAAKVKANIVEIMIQEKQAIMREAKEHERAHPQSAQVPAGITPAEVDAVAKNLMAPIVSGFDYNVKNTPLPDFYARGPPESLRDNYSRRVLHLVEQTVQQVEAYGEHMKAIQDEYGRALRAEIQRCAEKEAER